MSGRINTEQVLKAFGSTYQSIDIRSAVMRAGNQWLNVMTSIRLSHKTPEEVKARHSELERIHGSVALKNFCIELSALPFSDWNKLVDSCANGLLKLDAREVNIEQTVNIEGQISDIRRFGSKLRNPEQWQWPSFEIWFGQAHPEKLASEELSREVSTRGWSNTYEAINTICEIDMTHGGSLNQSFCISIPVYALVNGAKLSLSDNTLHVEYLYHAALTKVCLLAVCKQSSRHQTPVVSARIPIQLEPSITEGDVVHARGSALMPKLGEDDVVEVKALHEETGEIESWAHRIRNIIPEPACNALFAAVKKFCSESEIDSLLVRPHAQKSRKLKESAAYELHVSWLLSMYGFSPIILGEYEPIADEHTKVQRASVDIIAGIPGGKALLVVACTISIPKEEDFMNLVHAAEILRREVFAETTVAVYPLLFTGAVGMDPYKEEPNGYNCIPIIDADSMAILMEHLKARAEQLFLQFLGNPRLSPLRSLDEED